MNKIKAKKHAVMVTTTTDQQHNTPVAGIVQVDYSEIAERFREDFDIVDEASWDSFPASDAPSWIPIQIGK